MSEEKKICKLIYLNLQLNHDFVLVCMSGHGLGQKRQKMMKIFGNFVQVCSQTACKSSTYLSFVSDYFIYVLIPSYSAFQHKLPSSEICNLSSGLVKLGLIHLSVWHPSLVYTIVINRNTPIKYCIERSWIL